MISKMSRMIYRPGALGAAQPQVAWRLIVRHSELLSKFAEEIVPSSPNLREQAPQEVA